MSPPTSEPAPLPLCPSLRPLAFLQQTIPVPSRCVFDALRACGAVAVASSEEQPHDVDLGGGSGGGGQQAYSVAWDPLDGSSIIGANWAVRGGAALTCAGVCLGAMGLGPGAERGRHLGRVRS